MTLIFTVAVALIVLGFPFYWGAFGHPSVIMPIAWGFLLAIVLNFRRWRHFEATMIPAFFITLIFSTAASALAFALGRLFSR